MNWKGILAVCVGSAWCALTVGSAATSAAGPTPTTITFSFSGSSQTWIVPDGVTTATFDVYGAQGGDNSRGGCPEVGGGGGHAKATISVAPGETLLMTVGGAPTGYPYAELAVGGFNGGANEGGSPPWAPRGYGAPGGGGGGASDVRQGGTSLDHRVIVAGGGGGFGAPCGFGSSGGAGAGDGMSASAGADGTGDAHGAGGGAGNATAGGSGGGPGGSDGALGQGGVGYADAELSFAGGGGGGGLFGGGGGGAAPGRLPQPTAFAGAGGGGSGLCPQSCLLAEAGVRRGNGEITVTFTTAARTAPAAAVARPRSWEPFCAQLATIKKTSETPGGWTGGGPSDPYGAKKFARYFSNLKRESPSARMVRLLTAAHAILAHPLAAAQSSKEARAAFVAMEPTVRKRCDLALSDVFKVVVK